MAERGVPLHLGVLVVGEVPRLVQDGVGDADLADVVERRQRGDQLDPLRGQHPAVEGTGRQRRGQQPDVFLGAAGVPAGIGVAGRGQGRQRLDDQPLRLLAAVVLGVGAPPLGDQLRADRGGGADGQPEQAEDRRHHDAVGGIQGAGAEPDQRGGGDRRRPAAHRSQRQDQRDGDHRHQQRRPQLDQIGELGPRAGAGAEQGIGDGGVHLDAGEAGVERRRHDVAHAEGGGADEDDPVGHHARSHPPGQDVGGREVRVGASRAAQPHRQLALARRGSPRRRRA